MGMVEYPKDVVPLLRAALRGDDSDATVPNRREALIGALDIMKKSGWTMSRLAYRAIRGWEQYPTEIIAKRLLDLCDGVNYDSRAEMYEIAKVLEIEGRSKMSKEELWKAIGEAGEFVPDDVC